ncbi:MAG: FAD-dependent oxidoreductase [Flavobacteriaceae bacterium CG2_30_34_30]|nr:FAD-binding oxidoreductase [Flavobacteriia bacterium]OIP51052.1 MAG: FAD-dependent oxidoreductase [Flavobacteriaceae bacterium CG2_30_34_30]
MVDYIIVGLGLAGIAFCESLEKHNKSFVVFDNASNASSLVAGGMYNPVILKRFTIAWRAPEQMEAATPFYKRLEQKLDVKLDYKLPVLRRFTSVEEQNLWFEAADRRQLENFLNTKLVPNTNSSISAPYGYGEVLHTGRVDTSLLLHAYASYLEKHERLYNQSFDYKLLQIDEPFHYNGILAKNIVFAEGFAMNQNPFFEYLPLDGTKGELLTIKAPSLKLESILNAAVFIIPLGNDLYKVGATYDWKDKAYTCTPEAKKDILGKLNKLINCPYKVINQEAGIRPTVKDRKPLIGVHPKHKNMFVLNGLGTRGVIIAPQVAAHLYAFIENGNAIDKEMDVKRYEKLYQG